MAKKKAIASDAKKANVSQDNQELREAKLRLIEAIERTIRWAERVLEVWAFLRAGTPISAESLHGLCAENLGLEAAVRNYEIRTDRNHDYNTIPMVPKEVWASSDGGPNRFDTPQACSNFDDSPHRLGLVLGVSPNPLVSFDTVIESRRIKEWPEMLRDWIYHISHVHSRTPLYRKQLDLADQWKLFQDAEMANGNKRPKVADFIASLPPEFIASLLPEIDPLTPEHVHQGNRWRNELRKSCETDNAHEDF